MRTALEIAEAFTREFVSLDVKDLEAMASIITRHVYPKGTVFIHETEVPKSYFYIEQGLVRQFYIKHGRDVSEHFTAEGNFLYSIESIYAGKPTYILAEALEDTVIHEIPLPRWKELMRGSLGLSECYRGLLERDYLISCHKSDELRFATARQRYESFLAEFKGIAHRIPLKHIASYLDITQESLSRVRKP